MAKGKITLVTKNRITSQGLPGLPEVDGNIAILDSGNHKWLRKASALADDALVHVAAKHDGGLL